MFFLFAQGLKVISQDQDNCFLFDFQLKQAEIPGFVITVKPDISPSVFIEVNPYDTLSQVSGYVLGNAVAAWTGNIGTNTTFSSYTDLLSPALIRYPGGSWSDIFFWNACNENDVPGIPDSIIDGTIGTRVKFWPQFGINCPGNWRMNVDNYYALRNATGKEGLITINYAYARYGRSEDPVAQAAKLAADWIRYDNGRTKFWEVGNENGGPWEAGWQIDVSKNQDNQPEIINGELYGRHFQVFADSMRKAARETGAKIYIGAQILHYDGTNSWNSVDRRWNEGVFKEIGDSADFYVVHNYFGSSVGSALSILNAGSTVPGQMMDFITGDIGAKYAASKPIALTEWNINAEGERRVSSINGMQSILIFNELIRHGYGMSCRWLLASYNDDGMFYIGDDYSIPAYSPRPDFFFDYYMNRFLGDHMVSSLSDNSSVAAYAYVFGSGEISIIVVNKGTTDETIWLYPKDYGCGDRYYVYSLQGVVLGTEDAGFPSGVSVNDQQPAGTFWGPISNLQDIKAYGYDIGGMIKFSSPALSVQYIMIEPGDNLLSGLTSIDQSEFQVFPNPGNGQFTLILPEKAEKVEVMDLNGKMVLATTILPGQTSLQMNLRVHPGLYLLRLHSKGNTAVKKIILK
jgi:hypothetical protein